MVRGVCVASLIALGQDKFVGPGCAGPGSSFTNDQEPFTDELLLHELVNVEQYHQLGTARFSKLYVRGLSNGGGHGSPPKQ